MLRSAALIGTAVDRVVAAPTGTLFVDIETPKEGGAIYALGVVLPDGGELRAVGPGQGRAILEPLERACEGARRIVGHNIERHDWPILVAARPSLSRFDDRVLDTLVLNPLASPRNPYHRLVKDYKLVRQSKNDPVADCRTCATLFSDQIEAFEGMGVLAEVYGELLDAPGRAYGAFFGSLAQPGADPAPLVDRIRGLVSSACCRGALDGHLSTLAAGVGEEQRRAWAYAIAHLTVAGEESVVPAWVRARHPHTTVLLEALRGTPCGSDACPYCAEAFGLERNLKRFFGFDAFRGYGEGDQPLQRQIVSRLVAGKPTVAVLPTGGGKSLCYQLPAMIDARARGRLTIVISPLQSLMQDQVESLERKGYTKAASLNGRLTPPERHKVLEGVRLGSVHLLFIAPEQLRNRSFVALLASREVGQWILDEAHCLSKWGHDFRPDYLYIGRFIATHSATPRPVHAFTATARSEVIAEIKDHLRRHLGHDPEAIVGGHQRPNLDFSVMACDAEHKLTRTLELLEQHVEDLRSGGAIVFAGSRRATERLADFLRDNGWSAEHFHAGRRPNDKRQVQQAFIDGDLTVIAATCAFGMGVDKSDVRLVIHYDMPDSLENYLQEAGRAGRDGRAARCVLLYNEGDADRQFERSRRGQIDLRDFQAIFSAVRRRLRRRKRAKVLGGDELIASAGEILRTATSDDDSENRAGFDHDDPLFATKVRTAIAWMEECQPPLLERGENRVGVVQGTFKIDTLEAIDQRLRDLHLGKDLREAYVRVAAALLDSGPDQSISADILAERVGMESLVVFRHLQGLREVGVLDHDISLVAWVAVGVGNDSAARLRDLAAVERAFLEGLWAVDADQGDGAVVVQTAHAAAEISERLGRPVSPEEIERVLRIWSQVDRSADLRRVGYGEHRVRARRGGWIALAERVAARHDVCAVELDHLRVALPKRARGLDVPVRFKLGELVDVLRRDTATHPLVTGGQMLAIGVAEAGLVALQRSQVLDLEHGSAIFYPAMTLAVPKGARRPGPRDFQPLADHYRSQIRQVHIMRAWALRGTLGDREAAQRMLDQYFEVPKDTFDATWFAGRSDELRIPATAQRRDALTAELTAVQRRIVVSEHGKNLLVLAGPGSGKTRVVAHRVAWLIGVERRAPESILVLAYNRSTGADLRTRVADLVGYSSASRVSIITFHGLAMRLTGSLPPESDEEGSFEAWGEAVINEASEVLEVGRPGPGSDQTLRDRLLAGFATILVDEYQDINPARYRLLSAIAGRTAREVDRRLEIMAVGDDDQNIYEWQGASNVFLRCFQEDYKAEVEFLVDNFRSGVAIVEAGNVLIRPHPERLKIMHPIRAATERPASVAKVRGDVRDVAATVAVLVSEEMAGHSVSAAVLVRSRGEIAVYARALRSLGLTVSTYPEEGGVSWRWLREVDTLLEVFGGSATSISAIEVAEAWQELPTELFDDPVTEPLRRLLADRMADHAEAKLPMSLWWTEIREIEREVAAAARGIWVRTMHSAKGLEFDAVYVVAGRHPRSGTHDAERRLHYVAVTRAKQRLVLVEPRGAHPWFASIDAPELELRPAVSEAPERDVWGLGMADVDLGFAGRLRRDLSSSLAAVRSGSPLTLCPYGDRIGLVRAQDDEVLGQLSRSAQETLEALLDAGWVVGDATVRCVVRRRRDQTEDASHRARLRREAWEVLVPTVELSRTR